MKTAEDAEAAEGIWLRQAQFVVETAMHAALSFVCVPPLRKLESPVAVALAGCAYTRRKS
jgi:hypothetical protein